MSSPLSPESGPTRDPFWVSILNTIRTQGSWSAGKSRLQMEEILRGQGFSEPTISRSIDWLLWFEDWSARAPKMPILSPSSLLPSSNSSPSDPAPSVGGSTGQDPLIAVSIQIGADFPFTFSTLLGSSTVSRFREWRRLSDLRKKSGLGPLCLSVTSGPVGSDLTLCMTPVSRVQSCSACGHNLLDGPSTP